MKRPKLTMAQAREIRREYATTDKTLRQLAKIYGCSDTLIFAVVNGHAYPEDAETASGESATLDEIAETVARIEHDLRKLSATLLAKKGAR